ncbi:hypothetical protein GCM10011591_41410 [Nocardia camponoti]|uniref:Uncharacterized protein n=1 Tax=Nocardia camponoti TaxID=1616106 RepID=A0A917VD82_9NOCA|nr:hypothetical protein GCM10011591_41410 [Nocardia camponoti]
MSPRAANYPDYSNNDRARTRHMTRTPYNAVARYIDRARDAKVAVNHRIFHCHNQTRYLMLQSKHSCRAHVDDENAVLHPISVSQKTFR